MELTVHLEFPAPSFAQRAVEALEYVGFDCRIEEAYVTVAGYEPILTRPLDADAPESLMRYIKQVCKEFGGSVVEKT